MNILSAFSRDRIRAHQDAVAPLAHPIGEARVMHPGRQLQSLADTLAEDVLSLTDEEVLAEAQEEGIDAADVARRGRAMFERAVASIGKPDDDITVYLDDIRTCRPDLDELRPGDLEVAQMVETIAQHGFEGTTGLKWADATFRVRDRARAGVRAGLVAAGLVR